MKKLEERSLRFWSQPRLAYYALFFERPSSFDQNVFPLGSVVVRGGERITDPMDQDIFP